MASARRRTLLEIAARGTFTFDTVNFPYVYNSLIPSTVDGDSVRGKLNKIEANGVVENQLVQNGNFADSSVWNTYQLLDATWSVSNNTAIIVVNSMTSSYGQFYQNIDVIKSGHKYLLTLDIMGQVL